MIVLDTDHLSLLQHPDSPQSERLIAALRSSVDSGLAATVISLEEQTRGWLAAINRTSNVHDQPQYYARLAGLIVFYSRWSILPFDALAADRFLALRKSGIRIGTMDLKIAAIALTRDALLLSANTRDFEKVPDLRLDNWLA